MREEVGKIRYQYGYAQPIEWTVVPRLNRSVNSLIVGVI